MGGRPDRGDAARSGKGGRWARTGPTDGGGGVAWGVPSLSRAPLGIPVYLNLGPDRRVVRSRGAGRAGVDAGRGAAPHPRSRAAVVRPRPGGAVGDDAGAGREGRLPRPPRLPSPRRCASAPCCAPAGSGATSRPRTSRTCSSASPPPCPARPPPSAGCSGSACARPAGSRWRRSGPDARCRTPRRASPSAAGRGILAVLLLREPLAPSEPRVDDVPVSRLVFVLAPSPRTHLTASRG